MNLCGPGKGIPEGTVAFNTISIPPGTTSTSGFISDAKGKGLGPGRVLGVLRGILLETLQSLQVG